VTSSTAKVAQGVLDSVLQTALCEHACVMRSELHSADRGRVRCVRGNSQLLSNCKEKGEFTRFFPRCAYTFACVEKPNWIEYRTLATGLEQSRGCPCTP
jgi:hypothetical protein